MKVIVINYIFVTQLDLKPVKLMFTPSEMEFKEFEPLFKSDKTRFKLSVGLNLETFDTKELSFCDNLKFPNFYISATSGCKPLIFQTYIIWPNRINSLKYLWSTTLGCQDIGTRIFEFVAKTQFISKKVLKFSNLYV